MFLFIRFIFELANIFSTLNAHLTKEKKANFLFIVIKKQYSNQNKEKT
jgi:hypothetical protein